MERCVTITSEVSKISAKLFESREYFPIDINFGDKERIRISKRPRKGVTDIIDLYSNDNHIGMFVGIEKSAKMLKFGPSGINKSHAYRNILNFTFVKLMEYYGLKDVETIIIDVPENVEFKEFLISLGMIVKNNRFVMEFTPERMQKFLEGIEKNDPDVRSQVGQIKTILKANLLDAKPDRIEAMTDAIVEKIKNMDPLGKKFWDNRKVSQINVALSTAQVFTDKLEKKEFLESSIKTIVASFETNLREPYMEDLMQALAGKKQFSMPYIQKMVEKMQPILKDEIAKLNKDHLRKWVFESMPTWKLADKLQEETRKNIIEGSKLKVSDFGSSIKDHLVQMVDAVVAHYNGTNIFFGVQTKMG